MKSSILPLFLFCILVFNISLSDAAPLPSGISGFVYDGDTSNRVSGVHVSVNGTSNITDSNGSFSFALSGGMYNVSFQKLPVYYSESVYAIPVVTGYTGFHYNIQKKPTGNISGTVTWRCNPATTYSETISMGVYTWNLSYRQNCNSSIVINNTILDTNFTAADLFGNYTFNTNNPSANIKNITHSSFEINGSVIAGNTTWYSFVQNYNNNASVSVADQWIPLRLNVSVEFTAYDVDYNTLSISGELHNTTLSSPSPHYFGNLSPAIYVYNLNISENATTGLIHHNTTAMITKADYDGVSISFHDTTDGMYNSDTEFYIYNPVGEFETVLTSNGSEYIFDNGAHIIQILPASAGYGTDPLSFISVILAGVPVIFGILLILVLAVGLGLIIKKAAEV